MKIKLSDHPAFNKEWDRDTRKKYDEYADVLLKTLEELDLKWPELVTEKFKTEKSKV